MRGRTRELAHRRRRGGRLRDWRVAVTDGPPAGAIDEGLPAEPPGSLRGAIALAEAALDEAGVEESVADARLLLAHALGASPTWVFTHELETVPHAAWFSYRTLVARRCRREPLQHLIGFHEFWSLRLKVSRQALVPRPETELLVEDVLARMTGIASPRIADVGTGTGAVALALASEIPGARIVATDLSPDALELARENARATGFEDRVTFEEGWLTAPLASHAPFDALVANLPYIADEEIEGLEPEVRDHDPRLALAGGGADGADLIRALALEAPGVLRPDGVLALEVGHQQAGVVAQLLRDAGWRDVSVRRDFAGIERVVSGVAPLEEPLEDP